MNQVNSNIDGGDDAEQMRLAFQAFMLQGKGANSNAASGDALTHKSSTTTTSNSSSKKKKKKKKRPSTGASPQKTPHNKTITTTLVEEESDDDQISSPSSNKLNQTTKKRYYQLIRSFSNKIQQSWFEVDDQILAVLESIASIRGRLPLEWKLLNSRYFNNKKYDNVCVEKDTATDWKSYGLRGESKVSNYPIHLHSTDIQLALDHDLGQHEKMIAALRSLISDLSECHESLGRLVDAIWKFHLECQYDGDEIDEGEEMELLVQNTNDVYRVLSEELYRKQSLIPLVIESINDDVLGGNTHASGNAEDTPLIVARRCHKSWPREVDAQLVKWILEIGTQ